MKKQMKMSRSVACLALLIAVSGVNRAWAIEWVGGGEDLNFTTAANWSNDAVPTDQDTLVIDAATTVVVDSYATCDRLSLKNGAVLSITAGSLNSSKAGNTRVDTIGAGSAGTVNQSGGIYNIGHRFHIGSYGEGGQGIYNLTGGSLLVSRGGISNLGGKEHSVSLELGGKGAHGLLNISGGLVLTRGGVIIGDKGVFSVQGSGATEIGIGTDKSEDGYWVQQAGSTLRVGIDETPLGVTKILVDYVDGTGRNGDVIFEEGALLDVRFLGEKKRGRFVVMEWEGSVTDKGLRFAPSVNTNEWDFYIDDEKKCLMVESYMKESLGLLIN